VSKARLTYFTICLIVVATALLAVLPAAFTMYGMHDGSGF
jgi:hypothetical protein